MKPASTSIRLGLIAACCVGQPCPGLPPVPQEAPAGLLESSVAKRPAVFWLSRLNSHSTGRTASWGFFISRDGLALCALPFLCREEKLKFEAAGGAVLETPAVLAIFPLRKLALVKFKHQPDAWLEIAEDAQPVGTWVAVVGPPRGAQPLLAPILACRVTEDAAGFLKSVENPVKSFSIAAGRSPAKESVFTTGAPLINAEGKVVAVFSGSQILAAQTLRYAYPLAGCAERITVAVKKDVRLPVPISGEHRPYHPWFAHEEHRLLEAAQIARDVARARDHARRLVEAFPDCLGPRVLECGAAELEMVSGTLTPLDYLELVKRTKPAADANPVSMSAYHQRLGTALCRAGLTEEGVLALQKAFAIAPCELAAANLSSYHINRGDLKEAEYWLRQAAEIAPERFDFLTRLVSLLEKAGNWEEADKLADRIYALERLYSSR